MPAFINFTADLLLKDTLPGLSINEVVIEVLEDIEVTQELIEALTKYRQKGYTIALDDFIYDDKYIPLLKVVQIVKVDVIDMSLDEIREQYHKLAPYNLTLLAEKIETHEVFEFCRNIGFQLFQGYFLAKPESIEGKKIEVSQAHLLKVVRELESPNQSEEKLAVLILQDPAFTFKLLRIVNASSNQLVRKITSLKEVINYLGFSEIRKWALIIVLVSNSHKPEEVIRQLLVRGRMCENIAIANGCKNSSSYMVIGMASGFDALLDMKMSDLLEQISLSKEISDAITKGTGDIGKVLFNVINYSRGEWDKVVNDIDEHIYKKAYLESLK
ncbi:HDOD domain-containing protein [Gammaproteobacteria bacterium AS21]